MTRSCSAAGGAWLWLKVPPHMAHSAGAEPIQTTLDADVQVLWARWEGYQAGREPLQSLAYFCVTVIKMHGGEQGAAKRLAVSRNVLSTMRRLANETGDPAESARKAHAKLRPMTPDEKTWVEAALKAVIRRAGEVAAEPVTPGPTITMSDLPPLA